MALEETAAEAAGVEVADDRALAAATDLHGADDDDKPLAPAHVQPKGFVFPPAAPYDADLDAADLDADADLDDDADLDGDAELDGGSEKNAASDFCAEAFSDAETEGQAIR